MKNANPILTAFVVTVAVVTSPLWVPVSMVAIVCSYIKSRHFPVDTSE